MPRKKDAVVLGYCQCGEPGCTLKMSVYQNVKGYLYSRCDACGCNQKNGVIPQSYLWFNTEWKGGSQPARPRNVPESEPGDPIGTNEPENEPEEPENEPEHEPETTGKGPILAAVGGFLALTVLFLTGRA